MSATLLQPGEIPQSSGEPPFVIVPDAGSIFADRARRFEQLATGPSQGDWLQFLAALSHEQHEILQAFPAVDLPDATALELCNQHMMPPLPANGWPRHPTWQDGLRTLLRNVSRRDSIWSAANIPDAARRVALTLSAESADAVESLATRTLDLAPQLPEDRAASLYVGAALQVYWTAMASRLPANSLARLDAKGVCPCCGNLPVASVVRVGGDVANLRYLHCSLCNTEWNLVRVACAACEDNARIAYHSLQGHHPAVRAETCDACHGYLKIIFQEKDPLADPVADDLATTALDLLLDEAGYERAGPNLLLLAGG